MVKLELINRLKLIELINRIIAHNRDVDGDFGARVLFHIPIGFVLGIPILGWGLIPIFIAYEENEDAHTRDQAWKDYFGAMVGYVITIAVITIAIIAIAWRLSWL